MGLLAETGDYLMAADAFIARFTKDVRLRSVLAYMNPLYGGRANETPAYVHAVISTLYINGASRFVGGSDRFAGLLADVIRRNGGDIYTHDGVKWVEIGNRRVDYVVTESGRRFTADYYSPAR